MVEDIVKHRSPAGSPIIFDPERRYPIPTEPLQRGRKIHGGGKILRFSTEIAI